MSKRIRHETATASTSSLHTATEPPFVSVKLCRPGHEVLITRHSPPRSFQGLERLEGFGPGVSLPEESTSSAGGRKRNMTSACARRGGRIPSADGSRRRAGSPHVRRAAPTPAGRRPSRPDHAERLGLKPSQVPVGPGQQRLPGTGRRKAQRAAPLPGRAPNISPTRGRRRRTRAPGQGKSLGVGLLERHGQALEQAHAPWPRSRRYGTWSTPAASAPEQAAARGARGRWPRPRRGRAQRASMSPASQRLLGDGHDEGGPRIIIAAGPGALLTRPPDRRRGTGVAAPIRVVVRSPFQLRPICLIRADRSDLGITTTDHPNCSRCRPTAWAQSTAPARAGPACAATPPSCRGQGAPSPFHQSASGPAWIERPRRASGPKQVGGASRRSFPPKLRSATSPPQEVFTAAEVQPALANASAAPPARPRRAASSPTSRHNISPRLFLAATAHRAGVRAPTAPCAARWPTFRAAPSAGTLLSQKRGGHSGAGPAQQE